MPDSKFLRNADIFSFQLSAEEMRDLSLSDFVDVLDCPQSGCCELLIQALSRNYSLCTVIFCQHLRCCAANVDELELLNWALLRPLGCVALIGISLQETQVH